MSLTLRFSYSENKEFRLPLGKKWNDASILCILPLKMGLLMNEGKDNILLHEFQKSFKTYYLLEFANPLRFYHLGNFLIAVLIQTSIR